MPGRSYFGTLYFPRYLFIHMRIRNLLSLAPAAVLLAAISMGSCRKENGIDNNQVIQKPYSLFFSDSAGGLYISNNGENFREFFKTDGTTDRALVVAGNNVLWAKNDLYLSEKNNAFNEVFDQLPYRAAANWPSLMLYSEKQQRVYVASRSATGIAYSEDNGKTWVPDTMLGALAQLPLTTFAELESGLLFGYNNNNRTTGIRISKTDPWTTRAASLPATGAFQLAAYGNTLVAYDYKGTAGAWYTTDTARSWTQFTGIPANEKLLCALAPFGQNLLMGGENGHIYRLDNGRFVLSNKGIEDGSIVRSLAAKNNIFKGDAAGNSRENRYVYAATSTGVYRSEDGGINWVKAFKGNFQSVY